MIGGRHRRFGWTDLIRPSVRTGAPSPKGEGLHLIPPPLHNLSPTATKALSTRGVPSPRSAPSQRQRKTRGGVSTEPPAPLQSRLRLPDWRSRKNGVRGKRSYGHKVPVGRVPGGALSNPSLLPAKPSETGSPGRGGARERTQFSPLGGNGVEWTLRRRAAMGKVTRPAGRNPAPSPGRRNSPKAQKTLTPPTHPSGSDAGRTGQRTSKYKPRIPAKTAPGPAPS